MTKPRKLRTCSLSGLQRLRDERDDVVADGVFLRVQLDARNPFANIDERCAGVFADDSVGAFEGRDVGDAFGAGGLAHSRAWLGLNSLRP